MRDRRGNIVGSTVAPDLLGASGIWSLREAETYSRAGLWPAADDQPIPGDPLFGKVALLLRADGTGSTFVDSSPLPKTITTVGSTQSTVQSKFGGKSAFFDGVDDYLAASGNAFAFGTGDFTVEFWLYYTGTGSQYSIFDTRSSSSGLVIYKATDDTLRVYAGSGDIVTGGGIAASVWHHIAVSRSSGTLRMYVNGTQSGSNYSSAENWTDGNLTIGADFPRNGRFTQGFIDDFRITVGSDRGYTGATAPVPTAAYPGAVANSDPLFESVALLLHADGTGNSFVDSSVTPKNITAVGNATQSAAQSKFGGKSLALDGSGDYLSIADNNSGFAFGTGDFACEWWFRSASTTPYVAMFTRPYNSPGGLFIGLNGSSGSGRPEIYWREFENSLLIQSDTGGFNDNVWHHFAFVRTGTTCSMYIDGIRRGTRDGVATSVPTSTIVIGNDIEFASRDFAGNIDEIRVTKGNNRNYAGASFPVPTAAFFEGIPVEPAAPSAPTSVTGTSGNAQLSLSWTQPSSVGSSAITDYAVQYRPTNTAVPGDDLWASVKLLLPLDSNLVDVSATPTTFTALGGSGTSIDTANKKYGAGGLPVGGFPAGNGISTTTAPAIGAGDLTLEWWQSFASTGSSNEQTLISWNAPNSDTAYFQMRRHSSTQWVFEAIRYDYIDEVYRSTQLILTNPSGWSHLAIVRQSGTWRAYVNGVQATSTVEDAAGSSMTGVSGPLSFPGGAVRFGRLVGSNSGNVFAPAGYIDDIRLTLASRYPGGTTFTPPTAAHPVGAGSAGTPSAWTTFSDGTSTATNATITGLTNGVEYEFRVAAINAAGQSDWSTVEGDPLFSNVALLLRADGTGGTFTDSSFTPKTITAVGGATQSTTRSKFGGKSLALNGSDANLSLPSSGLAFAGDFVIEGWIFLTSNAVYSPIVEARASASFADYICGVYSISGGQRLDFVTGGGVRLTGSSTSVPLGNWSHFAFVRSSGVISGYVNGVRDATQLSYATSISPASATALIGRNVDGNFTNANIDELRITVGNDRGYTGATIPVPAAAYLGRSSVATPAA